MKMKPFSSLVGGVLLLASICGFAEDAPFEFSANVALTNDYKFYGYSQSNEGWAIQGGFDVSHESGFYLGAWASSIDFAVGASNPATIELDVYGGYAGELSNGLSYDFGAVRYGYPNSNDDKIIGGNLDYYEIYASFEYAFKNVSELEPTLSAAINVSPDWFGESGMSVYPHGTLSISLPHDFGAYATIGYLDVDDINYSYTHYQVGLTRDYAGLSFDLSWADAEKECGGDHFCQGVVFSISKSF